MDFNEFFVENGSTKKSLPFSVPCLIFGTVVCSLAVGISMISLPFLFPFFRKVCLPYVPATTVQVENVLKALKGKSGNLVDLGSGDGRIVLAAAEKGFQSTGVELNPWLVGYSKLLAYYSGVHKRAKFLRCDLWKFSLQPYNNIVVFGVETMMDELKGKLAKEVGRDTYIIACRFPLKNLKPIEVIGSGLDTVWVYKMK